jgi:hypothetical protein
MQDVTTQKTTILILIALKTSNLTSDNLHLIFITLHKQFLCISFTYEQNLIFVTDLYKLNSLYQRFPNLHSLRPRLQCFMNSTQTN